MSKVVELLGLVTFSSEYIDSLLLTSPNVLILKEDEKTKSISYSRVWLPEFGEQSKEISESGKRILDKIKLVSDLFPFSEETWERINGIPHNSHSLRGLGIQDLLRSSCKYFYPDEKSEDFTYLSTINKDASILDLGAEPISKLKETLASFHSQLANKAIPKNNDEPILGLSDKAVSSSGRSDINVLDDLDDDYDT